MYIYIFKV